MKTIVTTCALSLALCAVCAATAQPKSVAPAPKADTVMLSETTDGDFFVRKFMVKSTGDVGYSIRYSINLAKLSMTLDSNSHQLDELNMFVGNLMKDTLMKVQSIDITGYASPDGPMRFNEMLARNRAMDFKNYVDKKYGFSRKFNVTTHWVVEDWAMTRDMVVQQNVPDKQAVLRIIDDKTSASAKEMALKRMPEVWNYMKANILPPMRRVGLLIHYADGNIVEQRTMIPKPTPVPAPKAVEPCCEVVDETITGIIVEMPDPERDYDKMTRAERKEMWQAEKMAKKEAAIADKLARKEARAAVKIAKKADKETRKMAKAEAKAAQKSYKQLEKGMK